MKRFAALAALLMLGAAAPERLLLREQAWTVAVGERDLAYAMTHAPRECLTATATINLAGPATYAGRALFRSPTLLGGPAARAGLSCNACHSNGRVNANFLLPELTDRAGAADVTSEWSSRVRGDGLMNPVAIPDLAGVGTRATFGQAHEPSLETFTHSVVVEEFQGAEPPAAAMRYVLFYLRGLEGINCAAGDVPVTLASAAEDVRLAVRHSWISRDWRTTGLIIAAAQDAIGRIAERLPGARFAADRRRLASLSRELGAMRRAGRMNLDGWMPHFDAAITRIARREDETYFNEATLRAALAR